ncbi:MAG TPA: hypothetical protein VKA04_10575, partial [Pseudodesulfovibrio sp.]|nr:hypothetical protein [Pseudodesulfovibrio sp.]
MARLEPDRAVRPEKTLSAMNKGSQEEDMGQAGEREISGGKTQDGPRYCFAARRERLSEQGVTDWPA